MNSINFIKTLSPKQQYALARWYTVSITLTACTILGIASAQIHQLYTLYGIHNQQTTLQQQTAPSTQQLKYHEHLKEQEKLLAHKQTTIASISHNQRHMHAYIASIIAAVGAENITSLAFNDAAITIIAHCNDAPAALGYLKHLQSAEHFSHIKLIALQPSTVYGKQFIATITGNSKTL